jgi:hypothetical protein
MDLRGSVMQTSTTTQEIAEQHTHGEDSETKSEGEQKELDGMLSTVSPQPFVQASNLFASPPFTDRDRFGFAQVRLTRFLTVGKRTTVSLLGRFFTAW